MADVMSEYESSSTSELRATSNERWSKRKMIDDKDESMIITYDDDSEDTASSTVDSDDHYQDGSHVAADSDTHFDDDKTSNILNKLYGEKNWQQETSEKPPHSYAMLIYLAIKDNGGGRIALAQVYDYIMSNFGYYRIAEPGWKNSIRHNLTQHKCFLKIARNTGESGKGGFWALDKSYERMFENGDFKGAVRRMLSRNSESSSSLSPHIKHLSDEAPAGKIQQQKKRKTKQYNLTIKVPKQIPSSSSSPFSLGTSEDNDRDYVVVNMSKNNSSSSKRHKLDDQSISTNNNNNNSNNSNSNSNNKKKKRSSSLSLSAFNRRGVPMKMKKKKESLSSGCCFDDERSALKPLLTISSSSDDSESAHSDSSRPSSPQVQVVPECEDDDDGNASLMDDSTLIDDDDDRHYCESDSLETSEFCFEHHDYLDMFCQDDNICFGAGTSPTTMAYDCTHCPTALVPNSIIVTTISSPATTTTSTTTRTTLSSSPTTMLGSSAHLDLIVPTATIAEDEYITICSPVDLVHRASGGQPLWAMH